MAHTVEKIGGTSMSRVDELRDTLFIGGTEGADLYNRVFVVSAFGGITDLLLEHKKTGEAGVYAAFASDEGEHGWFVALDKVAHAMREAHGKVLTHAGDIERADAKGPPQAGIARVAPPRQQGRGEREGVAKQARHGAPR